MFHVIFTATATATATATVTSTAAAKPISPVTATAVKRHKKYDCHCKKFYETHSFVISWFQFSLNQQKLEQQLKNIFPIFSRFFVTKLKHSCSVQWSKNFSKNLLTFFDSKLENPEYGN